MTSHVLGIDPGLTGALALYDGDQELVIFDVPTIKVGGKSKADLYQLGNWLDLHRNKIRFALVEDVHSMPAQGIVSAFTFGFTTGALHGLVCANAIPLRTVSPGSWKRRFGLIGKEKDASRQAASRLAPRFASHWPLKKHDGRAEAFLIAAYGQLMDLPVSYGGTT